MDWHSMSIDEVIRELNTDPYQGLTPAGAKRRLLKNGRNEIRTVKRQPQRRARRWGPKNIAIATVSAVLLLSILIVFVFQG
jgi:hypothetical protein